jgi:hypothetical protein
VPQSQSLAHWLSSWWSTDSAPIYSADSTFMPKTAVSATPTPLPP